MTWCDFVPKISSNLTLNSRPFDTDPKWPCVSALNLALIHPGHYNRELSQLSVHNS